MKKLMTTIAAVGLSAFMLVGCEEALQDELDIDGTNTEQTVTTNAESADFYTDATAKIRQIELKTEAMAYDLTKYSDPAMLQDADAVAESVEKVNDVHKASQIEFKALPEGSHQAAETFLSYYETYAELEAEFNAKLVAGLTENDSVKINEAVALQDEMYGALGIATKSLTIALEGK